MAASSAAKKLAFQGQCMSVWCADSVLVWQSTLQTGMKADENR